MNKRIKVLATVLALCLLSFLACTPSPPEGAFPQSIGDFKMVGTLASVREATYIRHEADYQVPELDFTKVNYKLLIYPAAAQASAALESQANKVDNHETTEWEDRLNGSGQKVGKLLVESTVQDGRGYCALSFVKDAMLVQIAQTTSCDSAMQFFKSLPAVVQ